MARIAQTWLTAFLCVCGSVAPGSVRLVSTSPQITELLFQLGKGGDIVATSLMSDYPAEARRIPVIGPQLSPGAEHILRFHPDWVLVDSSVTNPALARALRALRIPVFTFHLSSVEKLLTESQRFLETVYPGQPNPRLARLRQCATALPKPGSRFRYLAVAWLSPTILVGRDAFLSGLLASLGGENALPESWHIEYPQVSEEWLLNQKVDRVYYMQQDGQDLQIARDLVGKLWPGRAVEIKRLAFDHFARATFTPLLHLDELVPSAVNAPMKECIESQH